MSGEGHTADPADALGGGEVCVGERGRGRKENIHRGRPGLNCKMHLKSFFNLEN